jgi:phenylalanyl-tRNA synthetase beta chain
LRASLLPGLLQTLQFNQNREQSDLHGFEIGKIHFKEHEKYKELSTAGILLAGSRHPSTWDQKAAPVDFYDLKAIVENLCDSLHIRELRFEPSHLPHFHPFRQARVFHRDISLGIIGEVHVKTLRPFDLKGKVFFAELNLQELLHLNPPTIKVTDVPAFPGSERDWTITVAEDLPIGRVMEAIGAFKSPLLESAMLLDLYKSEQIGKDRKNVTFRFIYRDLAKTVAFETVEAEHAKMTRFVADKITGTK